MRALEAFVPAAQRLFEDEIVQDFLPPFARFLLRRAAIRACFASLLEASVPGVLGALLCRTRRIDDTVRDAIRRGMPTLVILGAGLDTRPYRFGELTGVTVLEVDRPAVQEFKKACLSRRFGAAPRHVHFRPMDLNAERLDRTLEDAGLDPCEPAIFVCEGVTQYLQASSVDSILGTIANRSPQTILVFTYVLQEVITGVHSPRRNRAFRQSARRRPEPWHFGIDPRQLRSYLAARGLNLQHDFGAQEHQADYLLPLGRKMRVSEIERVAIASVLPPAPRPDPESGQLATN